MVCKAHCDRKSVARGLCHTHYTRWYNGIRGDKLLTPIRHKTVGPGRYQTKLMLMANFTTDGRASCHVCDNEYPPEVFDFHHISIDTKTGIVSHMNFSDGIEEVKNCVMLCSNCYRMVTSGRLDLTLKNTFATIE